MYDIEKVV